MQFLALYADRGWGLFDLSGNQVGSCEAIANGGEFFCGAGIGRAEGQRKFHCTVGVSGAEITANRPA